MSMFGSLLLRLIVAQLNLTVQAPYYICLSAEVAVFFESIQEEISEKKKAYVKKKKNKTPQQTN